MGKGAPLHQGWHLQDGRTLGVTAELSWCQADGKQMAASSLYGGYLQTRSRAFHWAHHTPPLTGALSGPWGVCRPPPHGEVTGAGLWLPEALRAGEWQKLGLEPMFLHVGWGRQGGVRQASGSMG